MLRTDRLAEIIQRDANGSESWTLDRQPMFLEAAIQDLFVAGDVRHGFTKRVAPEVGVGSIAIQLMHQHVLGA